MNAHRLLKLYPRAWRERYGDEFLAVAGDGALTFQQQLDIVAGAIDAWLSTEVRHATRVSSAGGETMTVKAMVCGDENVRYTKRDGMIGGGVMLVSTLFFALTGALIKQRGWPGLSEAVASLAFPASLMLSMPFWLMKGQPWRAQAVIIGVCALLLVAAVWLARLT